MLTERQTRISNLVRSNKAHLSSASFLRGLSAALGRLVSPESLLSISVSDSVRANYSDGYQKARNATRGTYREMQPSTGLATILAKIKQLQEHLANEVGFLLPTHFEQCIQITVGEVLENFESILGFDRDTLMLAGSNGTDGLMLDWNPDDPDWTFELDIWGDNWVKAVV